MRMFDVQGVEIAAPTRAVFDFVKDPANLVERMRLTFDQFANDLEDGLSAAPPDAEESLLIEEVKIGCTLGMLQCLDRPHRLAYVLGEILDLSGPESADAWECRRICSASGCSRRAIALSRSPGRTAGSSRIQRRALATAACPRQCDWDAFGPTRWILRRDLLPFSKLGVSSGRSNMRARLWRFIDGTTRGLRPRISLVAWLKRSTPPMTNA
ncbi:MAG: hypothetical protein ACRD1W_18510 [Vicinamibacterales bacterium]